MSLKYLSAVKPGAVALMFLMAVTRFHHFGTSIFLPDASVAVFFLAGLWVGGRNLFITLAGQWSARYSHLTVSGALSQLVTLGLATSSAFLISNGSFFLLSDHVAEASWAQYLDGVLRYYPSYLLATLVYAVVVIVLVNFFKMLSTTAYRA